MIKWLSKTLLELKLDYNEEGEIPLGSRLNPTINVLSGIGVNVRSHGLLNFRLLATDLHRLQTNFESFKNGVV